jgi:hypothetical protein
MHRYLLFSLAFLLCTVAFAQKTEDDFSSILYKGSNIYSKYVFSVDAPIMVPFFARQRNFFDDRLNFYEHRISTFGIEIMKYYPNRKLSWGSSLRYAYNAQVFNEIPLISIEENNITLDLNYRRLFSKEKPFFLDITSFFFGGGLSVNYGISPKLEYNIGNQSFAYDALVNRLKVYGLFSFGLIENLVNNSRRSSLSKLQVDFGFPLLSLSNNLNKNYQNLPSEIDFLQKSAGNNFFIGMRYSQFIDIRKNRYSYNNQLDDDWNEMIDPLKDFFPEVVKVSKPRRKFYGNFRYSFELFNRLDSVEVDNAKYFIRNKSFTSFEFGYSFHLFGNHAKYYDKYVQNDSGRRQDIFLSANVRSSYLSLTDYTENAKYFALDGKFYAGAQIIFAKINLNIAGGVGYVLPIKSNLYASSIDDISFVDQRTSFFLSLGKSNFNVRIESLHHNFKIFNWNDVVEDFAVSFQIGI